MNIVSRKVSAVVLGTTLGAIVASGAQAGNATVPQGFSAQQWNALQLRSEALDQKYHLGAYRIAKGDSAQAERALMIRSDALNRKYHLGRYAIVRPTRQVSSGGFDWGDAGIGSAATLGLVLAAIGATVGARRYRGVQRNATA